MTNLLNRKVNKIMCHSSKIVKERQGYIRRELDRRGIPMKAVAGDAGVPYATMLTYFPQDRHKEPVQIPGGVIYALLDGEAIPADLLSMLMPEGWQIVKAPECIDHDHFAEMLHDYLARKTEAHCPDSPAGRELSDGETAELDAKVTRIAAGAGA